MMSRLPYGADIPKRSPFDDGHGILGWTSGFEAFWENSAVPRRLDFSGALAAMKEGKRVAREGWGSGVMVGRIGPALVMVEPCGQAGHHVSSWKADALDIDARDWMVVL